MVICNDYELELIREKTSFGEAEILARAATLVVTRGEHGSTVFSGNDRVWSSDDCSPGGGSQVVTLKPGAAPVTFSVTWARKRSAPGCPAGARDVPSGTYRVTGRFGDVVSASDTFTMTA